MREVKGVNEKDGRVDLYIGLYDILHLLKNKTKGKTIFGTVPNFSWNIIS